MVMRMAVTARHGNIWGRMTPRSHVRGDRYSAIWVLGVAPRCRDIQIYSGA
jgi:hypothetical protein